MNLYGPGKYRCTGQPKEEKSLTDLFLQFLDSQKGGGGFLSYYSISVIGVLTAGTFGRGHIFHNFFSLVINTF